MFMGAELAYTFYNIVTPNLFDNISIIFILSFLFWEIPRLLKFFSDENTQGLYPEYGRITDFFLLGVGLLAIAYVKTTHSLTNIIQLMQSPSLLLAFVTILIVIPLIIILGFLKRFFARMESGKSITFYIVTMLLDLCHTIFYICFSLIVIPVFGYLLFGG